MPKQTDWTAELMSPMSSSTGCAMVAHGGNLNSSSPPAERPYPDNPVLQEVLSHISPQYRAEVAALIDDLGMEVVGRTRMVSG